jgi:hypothetical protein
MCEISGIFQFLIQIRSVQMFAIRRLSAARPGLLNAPRTQLSSIRTYATERKTPAEAATSLINMFPGASPFAKTSR